MVFYGNKSFANGDMIKSVLILDYFTFGIDVPIRPAEKPWHASVAIDCRIVTWRLQLTFPGSLPPFHI
jgi:hypothetical protein